MTLPFKVGRPRIGAALPSMEQGPGREASDGTRPSAGSRGSRCARSARPPRGRAAARRASAARCPAHGLGELVEAQRAAERGEDDREQPAPLEEVRRAADLLGDWLTPTTARHRARAPARELEHLLHGHHRVEASSARAPPRGCRRGRRGCARAGSRRSGPAAWAASTFCLRPPIGSTRPCSVTSPVIPTVCLTGPAADSSEASAVTIVTPALGPSFGIAPAGTCTWNSLVLERVARRCRAPRRGRGRRRARSAPTPSSRRRAGR